MEECIKELVIKRCEYATSNSTSLRDLDNGEDEYAARAVAEELCYQQGFKDALEFIKNYGLTTLI